MSDNATTDVTPAPKRLGLLAQFAGPDELIAAAGKVTDDGYKKVEAFSPFPVIGLDEALNAKGTVLPWIVFCMGLAGCLTGVVMQVYMNGIEGSWWLSGYDYAISGKPTLNGNYIASLPAFIPVTFELTILLSAFGAFFGMLALNQLPKLFNPLFRSDRFADVTTDGFFLFVDVDDPKYAEAETEAYLSSIGATGVETVDEPATGHTVPGVIHMIGACVALTAMLWPLYVWMSSSTTSTVPRISFFHDMEAQAKYKAQTTAPMFDDGRAARKPIPGTVAHGSGMDDLPFYEGVNPESNLADALRRGDLHFASYDSEQTRAQFVAEGDEPEQPPEAPAAAPAEIEERDWVTDFPESVKIDNELMDRGQQRFDIYCATCHGLTGDGAGLVTQRAMDLKQGTWVQPTSLHVEAVTSQPIGRIFNTISNGIRRMPGYKAQISPEDRWAIVLYVKALQRSQNASADDFPADKLKELSTQK